MRAGNACQDDELNLDMKYVKGEGVGARLHQSSTMVQQYNGSSWQQNQEDAKAWVLKKGESIVNIVKTKSKRQVKGEILCNYGDTCVLTPYFWYHLPLKRVESLFYFHINLGTKGTVLVACIDDPNLHTFLNSETSWYTGTSVSTIIRSNYRVA